MQARKRSLYCDVKSRTAQRLTSGSDFFLQHLPLVSSLEWRRWLTLTKLSNKSLVQFSSSSFYISNETNKEKKMCKYRSEPSTKERKKLALKRAAAAGGAQVQKKKKEKNEKEQSIEWVECGVGRDGSPRGLYVIIGICAMFDVHSGWTQLLYRSGGGSATGSPSSSFCAPPGHVFRFAYPPPLALLDPQNFEWTGIRGAWLFGHTFSAHSGRGRNKKKKFKLISMMEEILSRFSFFFFISWPTEVEKRSRCHPQANLHIKWFETLCCVERLIKKKKKKIKEWWSLLFLFQNFLWRLHLISFGRQRRTRRATFSWAFGSSLHVIPARVLLFFPLSHLYMWNNILRLLFHRTVRLWNFLLVEKKKIFFFFFFFSLFFPFI